MLIQNATNKAYSFFRVIIGYIFSATNYIPNGVSAMPCVPGRNSSVAPAH
jgi:hypothetical protein